MRIKNLKIKNIGPFKSAELNFIENDEELQNPPVIIITGENGSGKTILLDAIRALFIGHSANIEREIASASAFSIVSDIVLHGKNIHFASSHKTSIGNRFDTNQGNINALFQKTFGSNLKPDFIFDYWTSKLSSDIRVCCVKFMRFASAITFR